MKQKLVKHFAGDALLEEPALAVVLAGAAADRLTYRHMAMADALMSAAGCLADNGPALPMPANERLHAAE